MLARKARWTSAPNLFLADVLAITGKQLRQEVRVANEARFRAQETNKRMRDKAAHGNPARLSVVAGARNHLNLLFNAPRLVAA
jgi:hypothetical protein